MKFASLFLLSALALHAQEPAKDAVRPAEAPKAEKTQPTLKVGSAVTLDALSKAEWVQGEAPKAWEPGKVYLFECWATWCGPCLAAIPHVNELHKKYAEKGLRVYGIDVWEDGKDKVAEFVKGKGDGMSYPVAYVGKGGAFEAEWLKPAGVNGIPHSFIVKDGRIVLMEHPAALGDDVIEALLSGEGGVEKARAALGARQEKTRKFSQMARAFSEASRAKDVPAMEKALADMKAVSAEDPRYHGFTLNLAIRKGDWMEANKLVDSLPDDMYQAMTLQSAVSTLEPDGKAPAELVNKVVGKFMPILEKGGGPADFEKVAKLQWSLGDKPAAIASIGKAAEKAGDPRMERMGFSPVPYNRMKESMEKGTLPDDATIKGWFLEQHKKRDEATKAAGGS